MMGKRKKQYPKKISRRILLLCILLITILCVGILVLSYNMYEDSMYERYFSYTETILRLAIQETDADGIEEAIKTQTKNQAYQELSKTFNRILENSEAEYIYALYFQKGDDQMRYVVNGYTKKMEETGDNEKHQLGELPKEHDFDEELTEELRTAFFKGCDKMLYTVGKDSNDDLLMTSYYPVYDTQGNVVCVMVVDISMVEILTNLYAYILIVIAGVVILGILFLIGLYILLRYRIISPVKRLAFSAQNFISQQETKKPEDLVFQSAHIHSNDEIQLLSDSLECMVNQLKSYMENVKNFTIEQERVNTQFGIVQQLKENLFPFQFPAFLDRTDFDVYAKIKFSKEQSGDFYNFFLIDDSHFCLFAGTASGSGVTTTMIAMITTIYMENYARLGYWPNRILAETNNRLSENNNGEITVSTFLGIVSLDTGEFTYAQAGDMTPVIKQSGEDASVLEIQEGFRLGSLENVVYTQKKTCLSQGESIFLYTNGVPLRKDAQDYEYTNERLIQEWNEELKTRYKLDEIVEELMEKIELFAKGVEQQADETMLAFRYFGF